MQGPRASLTLPSRSTLTPTAPPTLPLPPPPIQALVTGDGANQREAVVAAEVLEYASMRRQFVAELQQLPSGFRYDEYLNLKLGQTVESIFKVDGATLVLIIGAVIFAGAAPTGVVPVGIWVLVSYLEFTAILRDQSWNQMSRLNSSARLRLDQTPNFKIL